MSRPAGVARLPVFLALCGGLLLFQIYVIFWQSHGTPATTAGPRRVVGEVAGAVVARQTFEMEANGLDAITIFLAPGSSAAQGQVVFELAEVSGEPPVEQALFRATRDAREVVGRGRYTWRFDPVEDSRGRRFALTLAMPNAPYGQGLGLRPESTRLERYTDGSFRHDGRDQWGDLVFTTGATRATSFRRFEHALRDSPWWLRSRITLAGLFLLYNAALFTIFWTILTAPPEDEEAGQPAHRPRAPTTRRAMAAVLVVLVLAGWFWLVPRRPWLEFRAVGLLDALPEATLRTTMPSLQEGFADSEVVADGRRYRCLTALPPSRATFQVEVPPDAEFAAWVGMRPDVWQGPGDGATFRIGFSDGAVYEERYRRHFYPLDRPVDRQLAPVRLDLSKYAGRRIEIVLNTEPSFNAVGDAALWCEPRVVARR